MAKKTSKQKLIKNMSDLWSKIIRGPGRCAVCGTTTGLQAHHLIPRANHLFRWDLNNGICLCISHHTYSGEISAHGACKARPSMLACDVFLEWLRDNRPEQWQWYQANKHTKCNQTLYISFYKDKYEELKKASE